MNHPCDPNTDFQSLLLQKLNCSQLTSKQILEKMGYQPNTRLFNKAFSRLQAVIDSPYLGMLTPNYDFKYSSYEFVKKLCQVLAICSDRYAPALEEIMRKAELVKYSQLPVVRADIEFDDSFDPSFMSYMAVAKYKRVKLCDSIRLLERSKQLIEIYQAVRQHYQFNKGKIPFAGEIKGYTLSFNMNDDKELLYIDLNEID